MSTVPDGGAPAERDLALDAARGVAVLSMLIWHTSDAFMSEASRATTAFSWTRIVGGYAAPLFFALSGLALGRNSAALRRDALRGVWVFLAGVALGLFQAGIDRAGVLEPTELPALVAASFTVWAAMRVTRARAVGRRLGATLGVGVVCLGAALPFAPSTQAALTRLDVLHGIGVALVLTAFIWRALAKLSRTHRAAILIGSALIIASLTQPLTTLGHSILPSWFEGLVVRTAQSQFALVPWLSYTMIGVAIGDVSRVPARPQRRVARIITLIAFAVIAFGCSAGSPLTSMLEQSAAWSGTVRRLIGNTATLVVIYGSFELAAGVPRLVTRLGAHSLAAYCIHLELAYGLVGLPLHRALHPSGWFLAAIAVAYSTWLLIEVRAALTHTRPIRVEHKTTTAFPLPLERPEND